MLFFLLLFSSAGHFCRWLLSLMIFLPPSFSFGAFSEILPLSMFLLVPCIHYCGSDSSSFMNYIHRLSELKVI